MHISEIGKMSTEEKNEILTKIGRIFLECPDEEWTKLTFYWDGLRAYSTSGLYLHKEGKEPVLIRHPPEISRDIRRLRAGRYQKGRGAWFSMRYTITPPTHYDVTFSYDNPPDFLIPADPHAYVNDLEYFPRDPEHIPTWLQEKIDEARDET